MKKTIQILASLLFLLAFTQCNKPHEEESDYDEEYDQEILALQEESADYLNELTQTYSTDEALQMCANKLLQSPDVKSVTVNGWNVDIVYSDGTLGSILHRPKLDTTNIILPDGGKLNPTQTHGGNKMLIWDAFNESVSYGYNQGIKQFYENSGFKVEMIQGSECDISSLKHDIFDYDIVHFMTHGEDGKWIVTKQECNDLNDLAYYIARKQGKIKRATIDNIYDVIQGTIYSKTFYAVSDLFINALKKDFDETLIINGSCESAVSDDLWNAFKAKGCAAYIGSDDQDTQAHYWNFAYYTAHDLGTGVSVNTAFEKYIQKMPFFTYTDDNNNEIVVRLSLKLDHDISFSNFSVTTFQPNYSFTSAVFSGTISNNSELPPPTILEHGFLYRTIDDQNYTKINLGPGEFGATFSTEVDGLLPETDYSVSAYAVLKISEQEVTVNGDELPFKTFNILL